MAESSDYTPGVWAGHDFKSAKAAYGATVVGRSYADAVSSGKDIDDVLPDSLTSDATNTLTIITDVTGSMGEWPKTMFSKLPYLEHETKEYLGQDAEIGFGAVGDANSDNYPVQARPYGKGLALETAMKELVIEGGGGGGASETYELAALYYARNVSMPKAIQPILIFIGDEGFYKYINPDQAKRYAHVHLPERITAAKVFEELKQKYSVYIIRKTYGSSGYSNKRSGDDERIHREWCEMLGEDHVVDLPQPERVVDVIFGILAKETDRIPYFRMELETRQADDPTKIDVVYKSLETVHTAHVDKVSNGNSTLILNTHGTKTKSLI